MSEPQTPTGRYILLKPASYLRGLEHRSEVIQNIEAEAIAIGAKKADRLARAVQAHIVVKYRYVHQTGGKPTTDDDMDAATGEMLDALLEYGLLAEPEAGS